jgi:probable addiction module antidote protein
MALDKLVDGYGLHFYPNQKTAAERLLHLKQNGLEQCRPLGSAAGKPCWVTEWGFNYAVDTCAVDAAADATEGHQTGSEAGGDMVMPKVVPTTTRFDAADYLDTEERQVAYIAAALESGDADFVRDALGLVARARGMGGIAKKAGLNRESLYKALGETGNPEFGTVMRIVRALGLTLSARAP